uniref:RIMS-binding protein 2 n=1 Tax=Phallusia mammillata TaxID=59560 RepID=A0A6F9DQ69_9ASCI|nr:RIMS-binding protein 2 [Phallusia mammillata]
MEKKQANVGRLQQMSEEMKEHIAQLKAELGNVETDHAASTDLEKEVRNKVVASALRRHLEKSTRSRSMDDHISLDPVPATISSESPENRNASETLVQVFADHSSNSNDYENNPTAPHVSHADSAMDTNNSVHPSKSAKLKSPEQFNQISVDPNIPLSSMQSVSQSNEDLTHLVENFPSTSQNTVGLELNEERCHDGLQKVRTPRRQKQHSESTTDTSTSSPRSITEGGEEGISVKYLQMSHASPRSSSKKKKSNRHFQRRSASEDMLDPGNQVPSSQFAELESRLTELQEQCELLAEENLKIKREQRSKAEEKIASLKKRNGELANIARRLEEKARSLQEQNVKKTHEMAAITRDLQQQKRAHQRHKGRCETEHSRLLAEKDDLLTSTQAQLEDLKRALRQARREKFKGKESCAETEVMKQTQKEMLNLQKLAAAASSKVVVRSLSTPVTARQKILEESNRNLRRQITSLEGAVQELESKLGQSGDFDDKLKFVEDEKHQLNNELQRQKRHILNLESQLQESKIEASDSSVQLQDLKNIHRQLQDDYSTVHEQLAVAIRERDQAVSKCIEHAGKLTEMDATIKSFHDEKRNFANLQNVHRAATERHQQEIGEITSVHETAVAGYQQALQSLQAKVSKLEQQCQEQDLNNKNLKDQLSTLVEWSKKNHQPPKYETVADNQNANNNNHAADVKSSKTARTNRSPMPPNNTREFTTSGAFSAFRKPIASSHAVTQRKTSSAGSSIKGALDMDDTEAEEFEEEAGMPDPALATGDHVPSNGSSPLRMYIAKYSYNPYDGPNESPEAELGLVAGDYVYVHGSMDDDGFFEGELINGTRGLVPSNFLEPVQDATPTNGPTLPLDDVIKTPSRRSRSTDGSMRSMNRFRSIDSDVSHSYASSSVDLESRDPNTMSSDDSSHAPPSVLPFPRKLRVDKKLSHSLIIGWIAPQLSDDDIVEEYHVLVDGCLATVANGSKSKAVVEHIYHDKNSYAISVCAITERGRSEPHHCTIRFGDRQDQVSIANLRVEHLTTGSARVAWEPVNSNFSHSVAVGEITEENKHIDTLTHYQRQIIVPCPMFRQTITGLKPTSTYEVMVKCKNAKNDLESSSKPIRFTTPTIGPPDPPLSVQVEENLSGSAESVQISWLPVTLKQNGLSNGVLVKGYTIHVNNVQITTVEPSTSDQCQLTVQALSDHVTRVVNADLSYQKRSSTGGGLSSSSSSSLSQRSLFAHCLPSVKLSVRTLSTGGQVSDFSTPYHLHRSLVTRLLRTLPTQLMTVMRPLTNGTSKGGVKDSKGVDNKIQPVVPSIEITHDTSSDEEAPRVDKKILNHESNLRRTHSTGRSHQRSSTMEQNDPTSRYRSKSASNIRQHPSAPLQSDEESEASVSSGHGSTSTSGSSRRFKSGSRGSAWVNGSSRGRRQGSDGRRSRRDAGSNSPHSLHSDDHVGTDGSWHSHLSDHRKGCRSESLSRKAHQNHQHQLHKRVHHASSQSGGSVSEMEIVDDSRVSLFVALYDYDPYVMSPNTDMLDDEISFTEGQLLKVYGDKDADGFYFGEKQNGKSGHIPCNMISEVQVDDFTMLSELFERGHLPSASPRDVRMNLQSSDQNSSMDERNEAEGMFACSGEVSKVEVTSSPNQARMCVALFDYDPKESSPNIDAEAELSFRSGDFLKIFGTMDEDGFFRAELRGRKGLVPSNFLEEVSEQQIAALKNADPNDTARNNTVSTTTMTDTSLMTKPTVVPLTPSHQAPSSVASTSSNTSTNKSDLVKKKGIISKGKKFFKKLGNNEAKPKR